MPTRALRLQPTCRPGTETITLPSPDDRPDTTARTDDQSRAAVRRLRRTPRHKTSLPVAIIRADGTCHAMTVVDVSETGMGLTGAAGFAESERIAVELPDGRRLSAVVRWINGRRTGLQVEGARYVAGLGWQADVPQTVAPDIIRTGWHAWLLGLREGRASDPIRSWCASRRQFERAYRENGMIVLLAANEP